ncbi:unknown [Dialister sp. CAG:486]|nr:unknown [Dialister sp. CAG:486]
MTTNEMNKTALNKVFEAYLDASRSLRKGQLADSERYHRLAFTMAEAYQAIGLMSCSDSLHLEIKAEKQAIKEWREGRLQ